MILIMTFPSSIFIAKQNGTGWGAYGQNQGQFARLRAHRLDRIENVKRTVRETQIMLVECLERVQHERRFKEQGPCLKVIAKNALQLDVEQLSLQRNPKPAAFTFTAPIASH
jgi:hypothetical protein